MPRSQTNSPPGLMTEPDAARKAAGARKAAKGMMHDMLTYRIKSLENLGLEGELKSLRTRLAELETFSARSARLSPCPLPVLPRRASLGLVPS